MKDIECVYCKTKLPLLLFLSDKECPVCGALTLPTTAKYIESLEKRIEKLEQNTLPDYNQFEDYGNTERNQ